MEIKKLAGTAVLLIVLVAGVSAQGARAEIKGKSGEHWVLSKGETHGVKSGMTGYFWTHVRSGEKTYSINIAKFKVIKVSHTSCHVVVTDTSAGYTAADFKWGTFNEELKSASTEKPPVQPRPKVKPKPRPPENAIPSGKPVTWYLEKGDEYYGQQNYRKAMKYYEMANKKDPMDPKARDMLSKCDEMLKMGDKKKRYLDYISRGEKSYEKDEIRYALDYYLTAYKVFPAGGKEVAEKFKEISVKHQSEWDQFKKENASEINPILDKYFAIDGTGFSTRELGMEWVKVEAGPFQMGSNDGESDEKPVHDIHLDTYYISKYEVTFDQYDAFCTARGRSKPSDSGWGRGSRPVIHVSWNDALAFCQWLSQKTGKTVRLPTEAEWEKAAKGGNNSRGYTYSGGNNVDAVAWYNENAGGRTHPVGGKSANELGIHDMSGNVWEWCSDWYDSDYYARSPSRNPTGPSSGSDRVRRGGSWDFNAGSCRSALRGFTNLSYRFYDLGFRPVMEP